MKTLHLNLKAEYFDAIVAGTKQFEYRLHTRRWRAIIEGKDFDQVLVKCGYPPRDSQDRISARKWLGYELQTITHPHFGSEPVEVFAIRVGVPIGVAS